MLTTATPTGEHSLDEIEALERSRRRMLLSVVIALAVWIVPQILHTSLEDGLPRPVYAALVLAGIAGALVFVVLMLRYHRFQTRVQSDPELRRRLDDERVVALRKEAIYRGWWTVALAIALGVAIAPFVEIPDQGLLLTLMLIVVNAPIVYFLVLDRD